MSHDDWIKGLNRIRIGHGGVPITIQGGEPSVHKGFIDIIKGVDTSLPIDILTNLEMPIDFWARIDPARLRRDAPYASIRVSYHHGQSDYAELTGKVRQLQDKGYHIGIWEVDNPDYHNEVIVRQQQAHSMGIDYRLKEFLGPHKGRTYGTFRYPDAVNGDTLRNCMCRTTELIIGPEGNIYRCHSDLYASRTPIGNILDPNFTGDKLGQWSFCPVYGKCNSCDIKVKTDRFQQYGHSSVEIKDVSEPYAPNSPVTEVVNTYGKK